MSKRIEEQAVSRDTQIKSRDSLPPYASQPNHDSPLRTQDEPFSTQNLTIPVPAPAPMHEMPTNDPQAQRSSPGQQGQTPIPPAHTVSAGNQQYGSEPKNPAQVSHLSPSIGNQPQRQPHTTSSVVSDTPNGIAGISAPGLLGNGDRGISGHGQQQQQQEPGTRIVYVSDNTGLKHCEQGNHIYRTNYGIFGIICAIVCFPCGLIGLCIDKEDFCTRCGNRRA